MPKLNDPALRKLCLLSVALIALAAAFLTGVNHAKQSWPFGYGYFLKLRSLIGFPTPTANLAARKVERTRKAEKTSETEKARLTKKIVTTGLLNFDLIVHNDRNPIKDSAGGLAVTDGGVLIARDWNGDLYFYDSLIKDVYPIALSLPDNNYAELPDKTPDGLKVKKYLHRYNDIEFIRMDGVLSLLVSYTYFDPEKLCFTNRLALSELLSGWNAPATKSEVRTHTSWDVVFETQPCLPFSQEGQAFHGHHAGGRLALAADGSIFLTVGDFACDIWWNEGKRDAACQQSPDTDYGKILRIDPNDWSVEQVSIGHRNPQGVAIDDEGRVWSVEHGPMGGDELNLIRERGNYGFPAVTLGVEYTDREDDDKRWPLSANQGRHDGYIPPVLAWMPSIGISNIKQIQNIHPRWDGDLIVSSLADRSLHRIRLAGDLTVYEERIPLKITGVRYVEVGKGELYILFDNGLFATLTLRITDALEAESNAVTGSVAESKQRISALKIHGCLECHSNSKFPSISRIFGTRIASQSGMNYSVGLQSKTGTWSETNLRDFLEDPQAFAPGTNMPDMSLTDQQIDAIVKEMMAEDG